MDAAGAALGVGVNPHPDVMSAGRRALGRRGPKPQTGKWGTESPCVLSPWCGAAMNAAGGDDIVDGPGRPDEKPAMHAIDVEDLWKI